MIKEALGDYFKWFDEMEDEDLPQIGVPHGASDGIFVGKENNGLVRWRPRVKDEYFDLIQLEINSGIIVHQSVKDLLNSWWFGFLRIQIGDLFFELDSIIPGNYKSSFLLRLLGYRDAHGGKLDYIPIGMSMETGILLVINNESGEVCTEDYELHMYSVISNSLEEFLIAGT